ncbi:MAG: OmpA family protein [Candidatus Azobacteroides sp.]|nr:OmpA family protein [Candidatus Azobacteroides sp.]
MEAKVRVYGKSQSRTALGIVNAYLKLYPNSTLSDLQQAFPQSLNPKSFTDNIIVPEKETKGNEKQFFERKDELIVLKNGKRLALVEVWRKEDFDAICEHAKQYGIEVAEIEESKPFEKGSYELEYLNEFVPPEEITPVSENDGLKKRKFNWWWLILLILLLLILLFCWKKCCHSNKCSNPDITPIENVTPTPADTTNVVTEAKSDSLIHDMGDAISMTLPDGEKCEIAKNSPEYQLFNFLNSDEIKVDSDKTKGWITMDKLCFEKGKTNLTAESENQLKNIASIMKFFPNSKIKMGGYTDNTGTDAVNMRVSSERAKTTAIKLISLGIDASRVTHEGYGSQYPVCPANNTDECRAANRRIDVRVTQK